MRQETTIIVGSSRGGHPNVLARVGGPEIGISLTAEGETVSALRYRGPEREVRGTKAGLGQVASRQAT